MLENDNENLQNAEGKEALNKATESIQPTDNKKIDAENLETTTSDSASDTTNEKEETEKPAFVTLDDVDYSKLTVFELIEALKDLVYNKPIHIIKSHVEDIQKHFETKIKEQQAENLKAFLADGGAEEDFNTRSDAKDEFYATLKVYKSNRAKHYREQEKNQQENLEKRLAIIEELKELINSPASHNYNSFKKINEAWKSAGAIPKQYFGEVFKTYYFHTERFFDLLHHDKVSQEHFFKENLVLKEKLIKQVEDLAQEENIQNAFSKLQQIHHVWKKETGPVSRDIREEVWQRFSNATKVIHEKKREWLEQMKGEYAANAAAKRAIIEEIKTLTTQIAETENTNWQKNMNALNALREKFFAIGHAGKENSKSVWNEFKEATRAFNKQKNEFYKGLKSELTENLKKKRELIAIAEANKDNEDFEVATALFKKIQQDWKKVGHVPKKYSDKVWKEFKAACNAYFDKLHSKNSAEDEARNEVYIAKKAYLAELKENTKLSGEHKEDIATIMSFIAKWKEFGLVPRNKNHIDAKFNKFIDKLFDQLNMNKNESAILRFKTKIETLIAQEDTRGINSEIQFVRRKVDDITKEIAQLENNKAFFSNASKDNPIIKEVDKNIAKHQEILTTWKEKLAYLRSIDFNN